ncbi:MAG: radical SAM protein [Deltaproteobacteria bacterium]|nr:radical SAM protein [Deltaproteobacteria bacterium]
MSAIAPPFLISWNVTKRCNLCCGHCYLDACELSGADAVPTDEALSYIGQIGSLSPGCMLVLTGGEPLLREDIFLLAGRASSLGLSPVIGTNGTLLTDETVKKLLGSGVQGAGVS